MSEANNLLGTYPLSGDSAAEFAGSSADIAHDAELGTAALCGSPRWSEVSLARRAREAGHARALLEGYAQHGAEVLHHLAGGFSLAVAGRDGRLLLAVDRLGIGRMCYALRPGAMVFGVRADAVAAHPRVAADLSAQGLYNYLYFHVVPAPGTIFAGVSRLLPGEALQVEAGRVSVAPYWQANYTEAARGRSDRELQAEFRELVGGAVRDAASNAGRIGAFLSGGTDSSTVVGMLARAGGDPVQTYSIGFDAPGYDEMEYARLAARRFGAVAREYYVTPGDVVDAIPRVAHHLDQPFGNASIVPAYFCARMAREDGRDCLLAGDGGDELFGGNYRYAKQQMFESYHRVPALVRRGVVEPVLLGLPAVGALPGVRKLRNYVAQARIPLPDRMESYNLLERLDPASILTADLLAAADMGHPLAQLRECYHGACASSALNRMLAIDMRFTLADSDLPKVEHACEMAGVGVRYPLLDERLVDFAASLPVEQKVRGTRLRHLFKEALRGILPDEIITKRKHGFGLPFGVWLHEQPGLRALAGDSLSGLVSRGILQPAAVDRLLGDQHSQHPAYFGTFIWVLVMLEQWLAQRAEVRAWN